MSDFRFPDETRAFLAGIAANNEKTWFDANRPLYDAGYVVAGRAFVSAIGPRLTEISPEVKFEPKINGSLSRINRDIRFSKDKRPYKTHLDAWFWHGEKRSWALPGFWFRLTATELMLGSGLYLAGSPRPRRWHLSRHGCPPRGSSPPLPRVRRRSRRGRAAARPPRLARAYHRARGGKTRRGARPPPASGSVRAESAH